MSGGRIHRGVYIECDGTGCHEFLEGSTFSEVWNSSEAEGWTSKKIVDEWFNYCPGCSTPGKPDMTKLLKGL